MGDIPILLASVDQERQQQVEQSHRHTLTVRDVTQIRGDNNIIITVTITLLYDEWFT